MVPKTGIEPVPHPYQRCRLPLKYEGVDSCLIPNIIGVRAVKAKLYLHLVPVTGFEPVVRITSRLIGTFYQPL
jgi:hypothetical protein